MTIDQRRQIGVILFGAGALPYIGTAVVVVCAFLLPDFSLSFLELFIPPGVDAPDNWAIGITRVIWLFIVACSVGFALSCMGAWLLRR